LDCKRLEDALRDALKSVFGGTGTRDNPRVEFYNKFQREMDEHDRNFEKKHGDLNSVLIFVSIDLRAGASSHLEPDTHHEALHSLVYFRS